MVVPNDKVGVLDVSNRAIKVKFSSDVVQKVCVKHGINNSLANAIYYDIKEETKRVESYEPKLVVRQVNKSGAIRKRRTASINPKPMARVLLEDETSTAQ